MDTTNTDQHLLHLWVIALFITIVWRDMIEAPLAGGMLGAHGGWAATLGTLAPLALIAVWTAWHVRRFTRRVEETGSVRSVRAADRTLMRGRWGAVAVYVIGVLGLGWLDAVRSVVGNVVLLDELLAMMPPIAVFVTGWWSLYPLERLLRESAIYRTLHAPPPPPPPAPPPGSLDESRVPAYDPASYSAPVPPAPPYQQTITSSVPLPESPPEPEAATGVLYPIPTRWEFIHLNIRHQMLLTLAPLLVLLTWRESVEYAALRLHEAGVRAAEHADESGVSAPRLLRAAADPHTAAFWSEMVQLAGVLAVFVLAPLIMRLVWDTHRLPPGFTRERLTRLCRSQKIRVRDILVWRTHGTLMNGAVMGLIPQVRYILLTDVMLDVMPTRELEAVMAHELGHVKHRHMLWLGVSMMVTIAVVGILTSIVMSAAGIGMNAIEGQGALEVGITILTLGAAMGCFGLVSRRFEWQADAFAARCLSDPEAGVVSRGDEASRGVRSVAPAAARAMIDALEFVARANHIPRHARSWRHGSIALRQAKLRAIAGRPLADVPADRSARRLKRVFGVLAAAIILFTIMDLLGGFS